MPSWIGPWEIVIVVVILLLVFGPKKLPELGSSLGKSIKGFKKGLKEGQEEFKSTVTEVREAVGADDVKSTVAEVKSTVAEVKDAVGVDEVKSTVKELRETVDLKSALKTEPGPADSDWQQKKTDSGK